MGFDKGCTPHNKPASEVAVILQKCVRNDRTGCLVYRGATDAKGYAIYSKRRCHRVIYLANGGDPSLHALHTCDNRRCCEQRHIYGGTNQQNIADKVTRDRSGKKLNIAKVKEILAMLELGMTHAAIAEQMGVNPSNISRIATGERWAHVTTEGQPMASAAV
jgi:hypothetical protein